jgi:hypothetical protein
MDTTWFRDSASANRSKGAPPNLIRVSNIIIIIIIPFIVLCKSETIVGQLGPKASARQNGLLPISKVSRVQDEEGRSTEYSTGTILANINRLVALIYFPQNPSHVFQGTLGVTPQHMFEPKRGLEPTQNPTILISSIPPYLPRTSSSSLTPL